MDPHTTLVHRKEKLMLRKLRNKLSPPAEARGTKMAVEPPRVVDRCGRYPGKAVPPCSTCKVAFCPRRS